MAHQKCSVTICYYYFRNKKTRVSLKVDYLLKETEQLRGGRTVIRR